LASSRFRRCKKAAISFATLADNNAFSIETNKHRQMTAIHSRPDDVSEQRRMCILLS